MDPSASVRVAFETARLKLAEINDAGSGAKQSGYQIACRLTAATLGVERVSVWRLVDGGAAIACMVQYTRSTDTFGAGEKIARASCPSYFAALVSRRVVAARDALVDPKTAELGDYLRANGVGALLDAPIYRDGVVIGVVCHEHCGGPREWTDRDADFASSVADMLTILVEQAERAELRAALVEQRQNEARAQKMFALQRLSRVLAHDLNNVLTVALNRTHLLELENARLGASMTEDVREVNEVLAYGAKLIKQLGDFSQERVGEPTTDLAMLLRSLEPSLRVLLGKAIDFDLAVPSRAFVVPVPAVEAEQLVLNLCMNAADAIATAGRVSVRLSGDATSDDAIVEVVDDGAGMDEETQARIFEPFFSTKSNHSGVGLMAVYGIVQRAGGSISLESAPGRGTRFEIRLPSGRPPASTSAPWDF